MANKVPKRHQAGAWFDTRKILFFNPERKCVLLADRVAVNLSDDDCRSTRQRSSQYYRGRKLNKFMAFCRKTGDSHIIDVLRFQTHFIDGHGPLLLVEDACMTLEAPTTHGQETAQTYRTLKPRGPRSCPCLASSPRAHTRPQHRFHPRTRTPPKI